MSACIPRSWRAVYWQEERKRHFHTYVAPRSLATSGKQVYIPNLKQTALTNPEIQMNKILLLFLLLHLHTCNKTWTCAPIKQGFVKVHLCTNFGWNPMRIYRVMHVKLGQKKVCHKPLARMSWHLACRWSNHWSSAYLWFKMNQAKSHQDMKPSPTLVKIMQLIS